MRFFLGAFVGLILVNLFSTTVYAQIYGGGTPFPTMPTCDSGTCGDVCGLYCTGLSTCSPFCNSDTGYCGYTCSIYQSECCDTCWGEWGECVNGWQVRVCEDNPQLGQQRTCSIDPVNTPGPIGSGEPTVPPAPPPGATNTPITYGTIRARAVQVDPSNTSCTAIRAVPTTDSEINGTVMSFSPTSPSYPPPQTQSGATFTVFSNMITGTYTLVPSLPTANWVNVRNCWRNVTTGVNGNNKGESLGKLLLF